MITKSIRLSAVGDIAFLQKPGEQLFTSVWDRADVRLANLEAPIVTKPGAPADKLIRMKQPAEAVDWLYSLNTTAVSLANNHMMDWGFEGLKQTQDLLDKVGIQHTGAGQNINEASKPVFLNVKGYNIAFLSYSSTVPTGFRAAEDHPGIASVRINSSFEVASSILDEQPGTPPWVRTEPVQEDLSALGKVLNKASQEADFVILAMHWGVPPQWSSNPQGPVAEYQSVVAKHAVNNGVDLIVGHHCHAPYGMETISGKNINGKTVSVPVLYSLGNYIFHPEFLPGGLDTSNFTLPYMPPMLPENHQSCVAELELEAHSAGGLVIRRVLIHPAVLNSVGEATEASLDEKRQIAERLSEFSKKRGTKTTVIDQTVVWEND